MPATLCVPSVQGLEVHSGRWPHAATLDPSLQVSAACDGKHRTEGRGPASGVPSSQAGGSRDVRTRQV